MCWYVSWVWQLTFIYLSHSKTILHSLFIFNICISHTLRYKMSAVKKYTFAEVKEHNKPTDLWVVIHDKVYDVTKFLHEVNGKRLFLLMYIGEGQRLIFLIYSIQAAKKFWKNRPDEMLRRISTMLITVSRPSKWRVFQEQLKGTIMNDCSVPQRAVNELLLGRHCRWGKDGKIGG